MTEIRSYRRVFDLERRIYSVDRIRLNPGGVPVRGIVYLLAAVAAATVAARLPGIGVALRLLPWYVRELLLPAIAATVLAAIHIDGRAFHLTARALAGCSSRPRRTTALQRRSRTGERWYPPEILFLPDGSDPRLRAVRYSGPGAVRVNVPHAVAPRPGRLRRPGRAVIEIRPRGAAHHTRGQVVWLERGASLVVVPGGRA